MDKIIDKSIIRSRRRRHWFKIFSIAAAVVIIIVVGLSMLEKSVSLVDLQIAEVDRADMVTTVPASGRVVPAFEEVINSPVTTRLLHVYAMAGDSVEAGAPLLQLDLEAEQTNYDKMVDAHHVSRQQLEQSRLRSHTDLSDLSMRIAVKEMEVSRLAVEVDNERRLDSLGSGTGDRVRSAETSLATARLELSQLRSRLENERLSAEAARRVDELNVSTIEKDLAMMRSTLQRGQIEAPHRGVLTFIVNEIGSQISAGQKVAVVSNLSSFKIHGEIAEGSSERMSVGAIVMVRIGGVELEGTVTNITPQSRGGIVEFVVSLTQPDHPRLRSGIKAELYITQGFRDSVLRIPMGPFYKGAGNYDLFVLDGNDRAVRRRVRLGESNRSHIEVVSGLSLSDRVIVSDMSPYDNCNKLKINN